MPMLNYYTISINPLAEFIKATDTRKKRIIEQQKKPSPIIVNWYQLAKSRMKKFIINNADYETIDDAILTLKNRKGLNQRQVIDRQVSLEALERFIKLKIPNVLQEKDIEFYKFKNKSIIYQNVEITVSPDVIFSIKRDGVKHYGAIKLRVSKSKPFDNDQQNLIASTLYEYLKYNITDTNCIIEPDLCLSLDVFGNGYKALNANSNDTLLNYKSYFEEIKNIWKIN